MFSIYHIAIIWFVTSVDCLIKPVYEDDPELYKEWEPSADDKYYSYTSGATYTGNLYAGRSEFPWIVDVRDVTRDQTWWATGNLMSAFYVLTNCRAVKRRSLPAQSQLVNNLVVRYCPNYLFEDQKRMFYKDYDKTPKTKGPYTFDPYEWSLDTGSRNVENIHIHVKCGQGLSYDIAVVELTRKIRPIIPSVLYMPVALGVTVDGNNYDSFYVMDVDFFYQEAERRTCYIGSFGRDWNNWHGHMNVDYKLRFRAYYENATTCTVAETKFQFDPDFEDQLIVNPVVDVNVDKDTTTCFMTRARVGTVCDHDRGAPLVCDGIVYGFVVRGAAEKFCSNLLPMPFIILKASFAVDWYNHEAEPFLEALEGTTVTYHGAAQHHLLHRCRYTDAFFILLWLTLSFF